jgi:hypothetical protein
LLWLRDGAIRGGNTWMPRMKRLVGESQTLTDGIEGTPNAPSPVSGSADGKLLYRFHVPSLNIR